MIYIANGAVLAAVYFIVREPGLAFAVPYLLLVLAGMNFAHALLMLRQGRWYGDVDDAMGELVGSKIIKRPLALGFWSTHPLFAFIHLGICAALLISFAYLTFNPETLTRVTGG